MLPAYIIEELRRREQTRREDAARPQPQLELPVERPRRPEPARETPDRGIEIIEVWG
jgi:hypothetical protein